MIQLYFDYRLLEPENALIGALFYFFFLFLFSFSFFFFFFLDEEHKAYMLDRVIGQEEDTQYGHLCVTKSVMNQKYRTLDEWKVFGFVLVFFLLLSPPFVSP
jgi:hypothetical protein